MRIPNLRNLGTLDELTYVTLIFSFCAPGVLRVPYCDVQFEYQFWVRYIVPGEEKLPLIVMLIKCEAPAFIDPIVQVSESCCACMDTATLVLTKVKVVFPFTAPEQLLSTQIFRMLIGAVDPVTFTFVRATAAVTV